MPMTAIPTATQAATIRIVFRFLGARCSKKCPWSGMDSSCRWRGRCIALRRCVPRPSAVDDAEDDGHEKKRGEGGDEKAANAGAAQRRVLLATVAQAQRHRRHADDHGES